MTESIAGLKLEAQQVLNQVTFLAVGEPEVHALVVMVDYGIQISEAPVVIEAAREMGRERTNRRGPIAVVRPAIGLEAIDANVAGLMQIPPGFGPQWLRVTVVASCLPLNSSSPRAAAA